MRYFSFLYITKINFICTKCLHVALIFLSSRLKYLFKKFRVVVSINTVKSYLYIQFSIDVVLDFIVEAISLALFTSKGNNSEIRNSEFSWDVVSLYHFKLDRQGRIIVLNCKLLEGYFLILIINKAESISDVAEIAMHNS